MTTLYYKKGTSSILQQPGSGKLASGPDGCCGDCPCCKTSPNPVTVDLGPGPNWINNSANPPCNFCTTEFAGDVALPLVSPCAWGVTFSSFPAQNCTTGIGLVIMSDGTNCWWKLTCSEIDGSGSKIAIFESTHTLKADFDCTSFPVTLTKLSETSGGVSGCTGSMPGTVDLI